MSLVDSQKGLTGLIAFNDECGADMGRYSWSQGDAEVIVRVPLPPNTAPKTIVVSISTNAISIALGKAAPPILAGALFKPIKADDSSWCVEDRATLVVTLVKANREYEEWWPHVVVSEPQADVKTLKPPSKHVRDMDQGAQMQIHKMMLEQEEKRKRMPNGPEMFS